MIKRETLEEKQISIYIITIFVGASIGLGWNGSKIVGFAIEPVIGVLLYSMFCQIPFLELRSAFKNRSLFKALLVGNFILIPLLVWLLVSIAPLSPVVSIGVLLVLLTPCIDYVIVFTHLGKGDSRSVLVSTPLLFIFQMLLLPAFLWIFLGKDAVSIIEIAPFINAFVYLIVIPFTLSIVTQMASKYNNRIGSAIMGFSGWLPVPFMALTFFVVIVSQISALRNNPEPIFMVLPIYVTFALCAPAIGMLSAKMFNVDFFGARAVAFSTSTRNSLVVLPLAFSFPAPDNQLIAAVIIIQTIVEVLFELIYIKVIPLLSKGRI
ncbi:arsenic resistance protein [Parapedobacter sp. ISTM3]|uniref:arsenic resistance protein n=1 Tax=Parapedobacter sp. ISTM3 TaxID=2800130 RepID=UPI0019085BC0|nr:arsenic resistance protein [Parapedobacter sp. ISTM3]MBK1439881.1 arsenic resistance protein [Parapedobacter sp. ISTM3]